MLNAVNYDNINLKTIIMNIWAEIRNNFKDDDMIYIDAYLTDENNEEGIVIAKVNVRTKVIEYLDDRAKTDSYAQEMIQECL